MYKVKFSVCSIILLFMFVNIFAEEWPHWRGLNQTGVSSAKNIIIDWSTSGDNLIWRADFIGRSTPVVLQGRVFVIGRVGENESRQERVACFDAENGKLIWEYRYNLHNTSIPFNRVGWASMTADPATGKVYAIGTGALFHCFDKDGKILWKKSMTEDFGARTGYGGRTTTPVIDEDLVIVGFVSAGWGEQKPMKHRHFAFDKHSGEVVWISTPGQMFKTPNIHSVPFVKEIDGQRLLIAGNSDGCVYAMQVRTGKKVWEFHLSKRGLNSSVAVDGYRVYAAHGEENIDSGEMGRIVCIDGRGKGDITKTHELWRYDGEVGFGSPLIKDGRVYYIDSASNLLCLDGTTGKLHWEQSLGTVGKSSPVWADGKIFATEVNGLFHIIKPELEKCEFLDTEKITVPDGRYAEIYSSPALAYNRVYFTTEEGIYCLGNASAKISKNEPLKNDKKSNTSSTSSKAAHIQGIPAELIANSGDKIQFESRFFDINGDYSNIKTVEWVVDGLDGKIDNSGKLILNNNKKAQTGKVIVKSGELNAYARLRVFPDLPWQENFENKDIGQNPESWIGTSTAKSPANRFIVQNDRENKVLVKPVSEKGIQRGVVYIGPAGMENYIIQADVKDKKYKRKRADVGLISHGYELDLMGKRQKLQIRSWISELRIEKTIPFQWEADVWYSMKLMVEQIEDKAVILGKVWPKDQAEPREWTISAEDSYPIRFGSPGLYGVSYTDVYFDNILVTKQP